MDRLEFLNCIKYECDTVLTDILCNFFDQYMLLYNLLDTVDNVSVISTFEKGIVFKIDYIDKESAEKLFEKLLMFPYVDIYEKRYIINSSLDNNSVTINITSII